MLKLEILVATMNQKDFSKVKEMNIKSNVSFANQASSHSYQEVKTQVGIWKMWTTDFRGVGKNRNLALLMSSADLCLLGDDDIIYEDDYETIITRAFETIPDADIIIFNKEQEIRLFEVKA